MHAMRAMHSMSRQIRPCFSGSCRLVPGGAVFRSARPYRMQLVIFLVVVVLDALIGVVTPVLAGRVVNEITAHGGDVRVVVQIAFVIAGLAPDRRRVLGRSARGIRPVSARA